MKIIFLFLCSICFHITFSQNVIDTLYLKFDLKFGEEKLKLNKSYISKNQDTLELKTFKFYISDIKIQYTDKTFFSKQNEYFLVDIEVANSKKIPICKKMNKTISIISFNIGVDSTASVSGALSGDLDISKGMYWAWQSGYINMKIEGKSNSCKTRKNEFNFHIGGYLKPNYALRTIEIPIEEFQIPNNEINISMDLKKIFKEINLSETNSIMIPGETAMKISDLSVKMFSIE